MSQPDYGEQALEIADTLVRSGAVDLIVVDSVAALVPKAEIEGEMGDSHVGLQARLMSQALRKLTGSVHRSNTMLFFINQIRMKIGVMFGSPETTTGGNALKFYSSVRLDVRRVGAIKVGELAIGNRTRVKVVKNKLAPPFASCEFDILFGEGISKSGDALDLGVEANVVEKSGAWYTYAGERIGQGRETARSYLKDHPEALAEIEAKVLQSKGVARGQAAASSPAAESDAQRAATKAAKAEARETSRQDSSKQDPPKSHLASPRPGRVRGRAPEWRRVWRAPRLCCAARAPTRPRASTSHACRGATCYSPTLPRKIGETNTRLSPNRVKWVLVAWVVPECYHTWHTSSFAAPARHRTPRAAKGSPMRMVQHNAQCGSDGRHTPVNRQFQVGDNAVYPAHGVAQITGIESRDIAGQKKEFYILKILETDMKLMIPTDGAQRAGLRDVISKKDAKKVLEILKDPSVAVTVQPWNKRYREYTEMLTSGSAFEVAKVLRDLYRVKEEKELSFSERRLLEQARNLVVTELALARNVPAAKVEKEIEAALSA